MKILVLNVGSSSIKYQLFDMPKGDVLAKGKVEKIGEPTGIVEQKSDCGKIFRDVKVADHGAALEQVISCLTQDEKAPLKKVTEIEAVGHRVVHGGERFAKTVLIDEEVLAAVRDHAELAPLHNPPNILGVQVAMKLLPNAPQVGVFDTAFHQTMPETAYMYAVPTALYHENRVRRYGFHGTSHRYVTQRAATLLDKPVEKVNLITCHLGNGASMAAIQNGLSIDTSMGLTPLEGLVMGTRSGDIDPAIIFYLARVKNLSFKEIDDLLNKKSGLLGLSGSTNDSREIEELYEKGDKGATLALNVYCYRIKKYIGAYAAALGRVDALVFTAGIGENSHLVRGLACDNLGILGIAIDEAKNKEAFRKELEITGKGSKTRVLVIPTDEEKMIAIDTYALAQKRG